MPVFTDNPVLAEAGALVARAVGHPVRLQILELLRDKGAYVMHLTAVLDRRQAYISQHLAVLREAGLVTDERDGMTVIYRVREPRVFELLDHLRALASSKGMPGRMRSEQQGSVGQPRRSEGPIRGCGCPRCCR